MRGRSRDRSFALDNLLGDGRWFVLTILFPVVCMGPWWLATFGKVPWGQSWGLFAKVKIAVVNINCCLTQTQAIQEAANRVQSASATLLLVFVAIVVGVFALWRTSTTVRGKTNRLVLSIAWLIVIAFLAYALWPSPTNPRVYALLGNAPDGRRLFDATLGSIENRLFDATLGSIENRTPLNLLDDLLDWANYSVAFAAVSLALASSSIGIAAHQLAGKADLPVLDRLSRRLDLILLLGAVVLAAGIITIKQWHGSPLPFILEADSSKTDSTKAYSALTAAHLAFQSVCYVGVLVGIYLPAALALQHRRSQLEPVPDKPASESGNPVFQSLFRIVAMLSPVLVGPLASIATLKLST